MQNVPRSVAEVLAEVQRLQVLCGLKRVIRYDEDRSATDSTESVAEHVYGLQVLARYFLPLESQEIALDERAVERLILWHDITEVLVGDVMGHQKTDAERTAEVAAAEQVVANAPASLQVEIAETLRAYQAQATREAQFIKALDKFEPLVHLYNERGKALIHRTQMTAAESLAIKTPYLDAFPHIKHFCLTLHTVMEAEGYFPAK